MTRWLLLSLGFALAAGALFLLARGGAERAPGGPPLDEIDDASRARLERVLRDAERE